MKNALVLYENKEDKKHQICARLQILFILSPLTRRMYQKVYPHHTPTDEELAIFYGSYPDRFNCLAAFFRKFCT
jgi:hypothetical protein